MHFTYIHESQSDAYNLSDPQDWIQSTRSRATRRRRSQVVVIALSQNVKVQPCNSWGQPRTKVLAQSHMAEDVTFFHQDHLKRIEDSWGMFENLSENFVYIYALALYICIYNIDICVWAMVCLPICWGLGENQCWLICLSRRRHRGNPRPYFGESLDCTLPENTLFSNPCWLAFLKFLAWVFELPSSTK